MPPSTRSGGKAPPRSSIYNSEPTRRQVQFPPRRRRVRQYDSRDISRRKSDRGPNAGARSAEMDDLDPEEWKRRLRQQTLTQINFVPASSAAVVELSDSEDDKEDWTVHGSEGEEGSEKQDSDPDKENEDQEPLPSSRKRRFALMDRNENKQPVRRKGKASAGTREEDTKAKYHTQTLTQLVDHRAVIPDSESDEEEHSLRVYDGFMEWLGTGNGLEEAPSPQSSREDAATAVERNAERNSPSQTNKQPLRPGTRREKHSLADSVRERSVIPQTPMKKAKLEIPSSSQLSASSNTSRRCYGDSVQDPVSPSPSPEKGSTWTLPRSAKSGQRKTTSRSNLVVEDSFGTEASSSIPLGASHVQSGTHTVQEAPLSKISSSAATPRRAAEAEVEAQTTAARSSGKSALLERRTGQVTEIPDSEDEGSEYEFDNTSTPSRMQFDSGSESRLLAKNETKGGDADGSVISSTLSSAEEQKRGGKTSAPSSTPSPIPARIFDHDGDKLNSERTTRRSLPSSTPSPIPARILDHDGDKLNSEKTTRRSLPSSSPSLPTPLPPMKSPKAATRLGSKDEEEPAGRRSIQARPVTPSPSTVRKPLLLTSPVGTFTQPVESQRVPAAVLRDMPPVTDRSDILLPVSTHIMRSIVNGHDDHVTFPFKIPNFVSRFWLFENDVLQYMATPQPNSSASLTRGQWTYKLEQIYRLNNAVPGSRIQEEDWLKQFPPSRYAYVPPAVAGEVLWNLRHALFSTDPPPPDEEDMLPSSPAAQSQGLVAVHSAKSPICIPRSQGPKASSSTTATTLSDSQQAALQLHSESTQFQVPYGDVIVPSTPEAEEGAPAIATQNPITSADEANIATRTTTISSNASEIGPQIPCVLDSEAIIESQSQPAELASQSQTSNISHSSMPQQPALPRSASQPSSLVRQYQQPISDIPLPDSICFSTQSQTLLTESQILSDSLVRESAREPPPLSRQMRKGAVSTDENTVLHAKSRRNQSQRDQNLFY